MGKKPGPGEADEFFGFAVLLLIIGTVVSLAIAGGLIWGIVEIVKAVTR